MDLLYASPVEGADALQCNGQIITLPGARMERPQGPECNSARRHLGTIASSQGEACSLGPGPRPTLDISDTPPESGLALAPLWR